jgi:type IV secretory pathway component VirB8
MSKSFPRWFKWMLVFFGIFTVIAVIVIFVLIKKG